MLAKWSSSMNDVPFGLAFIRYSNLGMIKFVPLAKWFLVILRPCTRLLCWLDSFMGLCFTQPSSVHGLDDGFVIYTIFYSSMSWTMSL